MPNKLFLKISLSALLATLILFSNFSTSLAQTSGNGNTIVIEPPGKFKNLRDFIDSLLRVILNLATILAIILIIYAGYLFITSGLGSENPQGAINKAKNILLYTIVGYVIILLSKSFINFIIKVVTGE